jgi:glutathione S-transferase
VVIADSSAIAEYLDTKYPDRPVFPKQGKAFQYAFEECFKSLVAPHVFMLFPSVCTILDDRGSTYFRQTREQRFGKKLEEISPEGPVREGHWKALENGYDKLAEVIGKNGPGVDYVAGGSEPTYADMVHLSFLIWIKVILPDEWEKRVKHWSGGRWDRLLKITQEWQAAF